MSKRISSTDVATASQQQQQQQPPPPQPSASFVPGTASSQPPPPVSLVNPKQQHQQQNHIPLYHHHHCRTLSAHHRLAAEQGQPLYLDGINHCPRCNPKHFVDAPRRRCQHDLRVSRLLGRPLRRLDDETIEAFTLRVNDVFKVCPLQPEWVVATTDYFKMDFLHAWLEGLRSKYMTSLVLSSMDEDVESGGGGGGGGRSALTVESAVISLRQLARQEDFILQEAEISSKSSMRGIGGGRRMSPPPMLDAFVDERWERGGGYGGGGRAKRRVNEKSQFVRIVKVNPEEHDEDDLDADGIRIWI